MDDHDPDRRADPAFVVGMFVGQFSAGVTRIVSQFAIEGTLTSPVDDFISRIRKGDAL